MPSRIIHFALTAFLISLPLQSLALDCSSPTVAEAFGRASRVFTGKVLTYSDPWFGKSRRVELEIKRSFKGTPSSNAVVLIENWDHGLFQPGEEVLVFAEGAGLHVDVCGRSKRIRDANTDIEYLNGITKDGSGQKTAG